MDEALHVVLRGVAVPPIICMPLERDPLGGLGDESFTIKACSGNMPPPVITTVPLVGGSPTPSSS